MSIIFRAEVVSILLKNLIYVHVSTNHRSVLTIPIILAHVAAIDHTTIGMLRRAAPLSGSFQRAARAPSNRWTSRYVAPGTVSIQERAFSVEVDRDLTSNSPLVDHLNEASQVLVRDTDLLNAAGAAIGSGGVEASSGSSLAVVQAVQTLIEHAHLATGLPWWATLAATGVAFRAAVFPFYISQIKATQRLVQAKNDFSKALSAYRFARTFMPKGAYEEHLKAMMLGKKAYELILRKYDTRPVQTVLGSLVHIPVFILVAYSARDMIRSGNFAGLETGGFWLWTNLKEVDENYILPAIASGSVFLNLELSRRTRSGFWSDVLQYVQFAPILGFPLIATLPQGVFFYWIASSWSSLAQTLLMQNNAFRRRIGLPPRGDLAVAPPALAETKKNSKSGAVSGKTTR